MYKVSNNYPTYPSLLQLLRIFFALRAAPYNLGNPVNLKMRKAHSAYNRSETLSHLGPKIWSLVPHSLYDLVILSQKPENGLRLIVPATMQGIFTSSRIYLKRLTPTSLATFSAIIKNVFNITFEIF